jgi:hypothetical protein
MKRAGRIVLNGLTGLSLVICLATAMLWVRSYWLSQHWGFVRDDSALIGGTMRGTLCFLWIHTPSANRWRTTYHDESPQSPAKALDRARWRWHGFAFDRAAETAFSPSSGYVLMPCWAVLSLSALLPVARVFAHHFPRKKVAGLCATCGYDLRATPDRCPECGTPAPAPPSTLGPSTAAGA